MMEFLCVFSGVQATEKTKRLDLQRILCLDMRGLMKRRASITSSPVIQEVKKMTKNDLINEVAASAGMSKKAAAEAVAATFAAIEKALVAGDKVQLVGFGTFEVRERAARIGRNPQDPAKTIEIPAKKVPAFRPGKGLKDQLN